MRWRVAVQVLMSIWALSASAQADTLKAALPGFYFNHEQLKPFQNQYFHTEGYPKGMKVFPKRYHGTEYATTPAKQNRNLAGRKLFEESLFRYKGDDFFVTLDPLFHVKSDVSQGILQENSLNTRGALAKGQIGKKVFFHSVFYENQAFLPPYLSDYVNDFGVFPGMGRVKNFKQTGYDFSMAAAVVDVEVHKNFQLQFGHGKNFIGEGYRSILLSDAAMAYPYAKMKYQLFKQKISVESMYASLSSLRRVPATLSSEAQFQPKLGTFHYISYNPSENFTFGIFDACIWQNWDSTGSSTVESAFFLTAPLVGSLLNHSLSTPNYSIFGLNAAYSPWPFAMVYGQFATNAGSELVSGNSFQLGTRFSKQFIDKLAVFAQLEYNQTAPFIYNYTRDLQRYSHFNQPLAHASGNDVQEWILMGGLNFDRIQVRAKYISASEQWPINQDASVSVLNIENDVGAVAPFNTYDTDLSLSYLLNPSTNLMLRVGVINRINRSGSFTRDDENWFYLALITSIHNLYFDF